MDVRIAYLINICILVILMLLMPKLIEGRVKVTRKMGLLRIADWHERNLEVIVKVVRMIFAVIILILLLLTARTF